MPFSMKKAFYFMGWNNSESCKENPKEINAKGIVCLQ
jgi:hypothetical protein